MARFDWGDGKGRVHSRPKRSAQQLAAAKDRKVMNDPTYFRSPATLGDVLQEAKRADDLRYGGVQSQLNVQGQQIPEWFAQYRATLQTPQQVQQTYQPIVAQQQQMAQQSAAPTPGLDPNSQAGQADAQAAKAREALANLGTSVLLAQQGADSTYFQGRQGVSQAAQIGAEFQNRQSQQDLARERGDFRAQYVTDARDRERRYGLDLQHQGNENKAFGLDVYKAEQDAADARVKRRLDRRRDRARQRDKDEDQALARRREERMAQPKPEKPKEPDTGAKRDLRKAVALVQGKLAGKQNAPSSFWQQAYQALVSEKDMDPALARAAIQLVRLGHVGGKTRRVLEEDYGITKLPRGTKRKKPAPYTLPARPPSAPSEGGSRPT